MALTKDVERRMMLVGSYEVSIPAAGADVFYKGALVNITAAGSIAVASDTSGEIFGGIVVDAVTATGAASHKVKIKRSSKVWIPLGTTVLTDMGVDVFATTDDGIARTATNTKRMGIVVDYNETDDEVLVDTAYANNA